MIDGSGLRLLLYLVAAGMIFIGLLRVYLGDRVSALRRKGAVVPEVPKLINWTPKEEFRLLKFLYSGAFKRVEHRALRRGFRLLRDLISLFYPLMLISGIWLASIARG